MEMTYFNVDGDVAEEEIDPLSFDGYDYAYMYDSHPDYSDEYDIEHEDGPFVVFVKVSLTMACFIAIMATAIVMIFGSGLF